jgi:hypothetical protein
MLLLRVEEITMPFRNPPIRNYWPIALLLLTFEGGWLMPMLYVLPWLAHT